MSLQTGLKFKTTATLESIESWMDANCQGEWDVEIVAISTTLHQKTVAAYFENESDKDAFKSAYNSL